MLLSRRPLVLIAGLFPFVLIAITLTVFARTRDPMAFAYGGLLACIHLLGFVLLARRMRKRTGTKRRN